MPTYDCFMFNDEIEILKWRIEYLKGVVDYFVIAESNTTFSGKPKPSFLRQTLPAVDIDPKRIILAEYEFPVEMLKERNFSGNNWPLEKFGRNSLSKIIDNLEVEDFVLLSDLDEIPTCKQVLKGLKYGQLSSLVTPLHYGKINWLSPDGLNWQSVKIGPASQFKNKNLSELKHHRLPLITSPAGSHLSDQFINFENVKIKALNSAHSEFQQNMVLLEAIFKFSVKYRVNHFGRFTRKGMGLIRTQKESELNDFQKNLLSTNPEYFDFSNPQVNTLLRLSASYVVDRCWQTGQVPQISNCRMWLVIPKALLAFWTARATSNFLRLKKRILKLFRLS